MDKVAFLVGEIFLIFGGTFLLCCALTVLSKLMCEAWVAFSNRFRDICKAESLIFEYRKYREQFLKWMKISEEECGEK